jgi:hypothetical protein
VALCTTCTVHVETRSAGFLVEPQYQDRRFVSGLASKSLGCFISGLTLKPLGRFLSGLTSKPLRRFLIGLGLKIDGDGLSVVWPQNHWNGFLWFVLKIDDDGF